MIPHTLMPPDHYREMAKAIVDNAGGIHEFLNACESCGLPVTDRRNELNSHVEFARAFLQNFFPDAT
jgi:hypothetical protein